MTYLSVKEVSKKWGITDRRIRVLCSEGRVEGATKIVVVGQFLKMQLNL